VNMSEAELVSLCRRLQWTIMLMLVAMMICFGIIEMQVANISRQLL